MNYITVKCSPEYMQVGGFGHMMNDVLSAYYISFLCDNLTYAHSPIHVLNEHYHRNCNTDKYNDVNTYLTDIDYILQFGKDEIQVVDIEENVTTHFLNVVPAFKTIHEHLNVFNNFTNTLFILCNNNRLHLNEIMYIFPDKYVTLYDNLYRKAKHLLVTRAISNNTITICIHIRRGDWDWQPIEYTINILNYLYKLLTPQYALHITIFSIGTGEQLATLQSQLSNYKVQFVFNNSLFETVSEFYNCDILVGGHSCLPKIISLFSRNIFIFLPFNDGETRVLGGGVTGSLYNWGTHLEGIDHSRCIMTNINVTKNKDVIDKVILGIYCKST